MRILTIGILTGLLYFYPSTWWFSDIINAFYANFSTELISIALTILLINFLYEKKETKALKSRLIRELGSHDKGFTSRALKELREFGWVQDGSLSDKDFSSANLSGLDFSNAILVGTKFNKANLKEIDFTGADLTDAELEEADLSGAKLNDCTLHNCNLNEAKLHEAKLNGVNLKNTECNKAVFNMSQLRGAQIELTEMCDANFSFADFEGATIKDTNFLRVNFEGCNFDGARFEKNDLTHSTSWEKTIKIEKGTFLGSINPPADFLKLTSNQQ